MQAIIALEGLEAAFARTDTDDRLGVDAKTRHALDIGAHVGLAGEHRAPSQRAQIIAHGHLADA